MEIEVLGQGKTDPPCLNRYTFMQKVLDLSNMEKLIFCVVEGGVVGGEPSVIIGCPSPHGIAFLQTSLDKLMAATSACASLAESRFNWVRPEGHASLMPPSAKVRKEMLLAIQKELEGFEEVEKEVDGE